MKIKLSLQRSAGVVDVVATVESATTVGDLARYLLRVDPSARGEVAVENATLTVAGAQALALDARQPVGESGLRSGDTVSISRGSTEFVDPQRSAAALVRVVGGPDTGQEFRIPLGSSIIGRERGCEVRLSDTMVSRRHARLNVADVVEIIDLGSANGIQIDEIAVPRSILRAGDIVQVGDSTLSVRRLPAPTRQQDAIAGSDVEIIRAPRLDPVYQGAKWEAPEPPERPKPQRMPVIALLAPILMGALLYLVTKSLASIFFVALSPVMLVGNALESRASGRRDYRSAVADFWADVDALSKELDGAFAEEANGRRAEHPETNACVASARANGPLLWTRRPAYRGFVSVRIGSGRLPTRHDIVLPSAKKATRTLYRQLVDRLRPYAAVDDVPVIADLRASALGIAGPRAQALGLGRAVVAQLAALHSPAELVITAVAPAGHAAEWDWLKWLPHTSPPNSPLAGRHLASSSTAGTSLVSELEDLIRQRRDADTDSPVAVPSIVVLVEAEAPVAHNRLAGLAADGAAVGVHVVWLAAEVSALPAACETFVEIARDGVHGSTGYVHIGAAVEPLDLDVLPPQEAADFARALAPMTDLDAKADDASNLPRSVSLLSITGTELATSADSVIERWTENRSIVSGPLAPTTAKPHVGTLRAVIGQSATEVHALDLRADGPHALVGGTTGSGKSELLQTWILAMAAAHSPQRLTFLLVDYKGGAAFKECKDLPHTVGLVTDLSPHLVRRALTSLSAELRRREEFLHVQGAKDLQELEKRGIPDAPPSLVIIVDEFAALVSEVPEFVDGVVNVAQRGRSLGLHLILATQRPAGVIKDNLRANTNLRLALRVADEADSTDVLGASDAAYFDPAVPGRAVSKTGPGRLVPFQAGYAGGWTSDEPPRPEIVVEELTFGSSAIWALPEPAEQEVVRDAGLTDIQRLVHCITSASAAAEIAEPRKPWQSELRPVYDLSDPTQVQWRRRDDELVFGIQDDPAHQRQPTIAFHPDRDGNLAVYGTGGSGKSTLLRTLAVAAGFTIRGGPCHVYGIDFGARGLAMLDSLPHVGSIISGGDFERITRLILWLRELIDARALAYSRANAGTISEYRARVPEAAQEPRILVLIDGLSAFRQAFETADRQRWFDMFVSLAADGRQVGVHLVLASEQRGGMTTALASAVQRRVVLRMATSDDYSMLGVPSDVLSATSVPGRGLLGDAELQVAMLGAHTDVGAQARAVKGFAESMRRLSVGEAPPIQRLPDVVPAERLPKEVDGLPALGLSGETLAPLAFDARGGFVISGPPGSGRTTTICAVADAVHRWRPGIRLVLFSARRTELTANHIWDASAAGATDVAAAAASLIAELPSMSLMAQDSVAIFVEGISDFTGGVADAPLTELLKLCTAEGLLFVGEGETSGLAGGIGVVGQIKASRAGIALTPETNDGPTVFRTNFPARINRADFPPGRGLLVGRGKTRLVQVARADISNVRSG